MAEEVTDELREWTGTALRETAGARIQTAPLALWIKPFQMWRAFDCAVYAPEVTGFPAGEYVLGRHKIEVEPCSGGEWRGPLAMHAMEMVQQGATLTCGQFEYDWDVERVVVLQYDGQHLGGFVSLPRVRPNERALVLCADVVVTGLVNFLKAHAEEGWKQVRHPKGLPSGWNAFKDVLIRLDTRPPEAEFPALIPRNKVRHIALDGGLRLDVSTWLYGAEPVVRVAHPHPGQLQIIVDGVTHVDTYDTQAELDLSRIGILPGLHEIRGSGDTETLYTAASGDFAALHAEQPVPLAYILRRSGMDYDAVFPSPQPLSDTVPFGSIAVLGALIYGDEQDFPPRAPSRRVVGALVKLGQVVSIGLDSEKDQDFVQVMEAARQIEDLTRSLGENLTVSERRDFLASAARLFVVAAPHVSPHSPLAERAVLLLKAKDIYDEINDPDGRLKAAIVLAQLIEAAAECDLGIRELDRALHGYQGDPDLEVRGYETLARLYLLKGDDDAVEFYAELLNEVRGSPGETVLYANFAFARGKAAHKRKNWDTAGAHYQDAIELAQHYGDRALELEVEKSAAQNCQSAWEFDSAKRYWADALRSAESLQRVAQVSVCATNLGTMLMVIAATRKDWDQAQKMLVRSLECGAFHQPTLFRLTAAGKLAELAFMRRQGSGAKGWIDETMGMCQRSETLRSLGGEGLAEALTALADERLGRFQEAAARLEPLESQPGRYADIVHRVLAGALYGLGRYADAARAASAGRAFAHESKSLFDATECMRIEALCAECWEQADMKFTAAERLSNDIPAPYARARILRSYASAARQHGHFATAFTALDEAVSIFNMLDSWEAPIAAREVQLAREVR